LGRLTLCIEKSGKFRQNSGKKLGKVSKLKKSGKLKFKELGKIGKIRPEIRKIWRIGQTA
jgi:hypothetical protein